MVYIPNIPNKAVLEVRTVLILTGELFDFAHSLTRDRSYDRGVQALITLNHELRNAFPDLIETSEEAFRSGLSDALERVNCALQEGVGSYAWDASFNFTGGMESRFPQLLEIRTVDEAANFLKFLLESAWARINIASSPRTALENVRIPRPEIAPTILRSKRIGSSSRRRRWMRVGMRLSQ